MNKIALFADVQNIYYTTRQAYGRQFNYRKLWERLLYEGDIVIAELDCPRFNDRTMVFELVQTQ